MKVATQNGLAGQITQRIQAVRLTCFRHGHLMQRSQLPALRKELEGEGYEFVSTSDTETLLRLYARDGHRLSMPSSPHTTVWRWAR